MTRASKAWGIAAVAFLLALHFAMAVLSKRHESTTSDELVHVTGGYSYWAFDDYRLQPENGNLPQRWVALPAWAMGAPFPSLDQTYWRDSDVWVMGHEFFYESGHDHFPMLMAARAMTGLFSVALGALIFCWSRRLFGLKGAFISLTLFAFSPTFLAHGGYATSDVCISLFMLASIGAWWRHLNTPGIGPFLLSSVLFGLACVAKFSAVFLLPMMALCAVVYIAARRGEVLEILLSAVGHALVAGAVIWAFYGFRYSAFNPAVPSADQFIQSWPEMYAHTGRPGRLIHVLADWRLLPEAFLYGAAYVVETSQSRGAFLNGDYSITGWRSFFVWAFLYKSTLPFILVCAWSAWSALKAMFGRATSRASRWEGLLPLTPLLALFAVYWAVSIASHLNIGHRHLLPVYPVLFILAGALGRWFTPPMGWRALLTAALISWHIAESVWISPHYLAYFNELAGGPLGGHLRLSDSNVDWGQDLPGLADWLEHNARPGETAYLAYIGSAEPRYYHLPVRRLAYINGFHEDQPYLPLGPGLYCVSATMLEQVYTSVRGPWTVDLEKEYQSLRTFESAFAAYAAHPAWRPQLEGNVPAARWVATRDRFLSLRFARLCYCLRARQPDANIGYSIFVYRLSAKDVSDATEGSLGDWISLIKRSGVSRSGP